METDVKPPSPLEISEAVRELMRGDIPAGSARLSAAARSHKLITELLRTLTAQACRALNAPETPAVKGFVDGVFGLGLNFGLRIGEARARFKREGAA